MVESIEATSDGFAAGAAAACACGVCDGAGVGLSVWPIAILAVQRMTTKKMAAADSDFKAVAPVQWDVELILEHNPDTSKITATSIDTLLPGHI